MIIFLFFKLSALEDSNIEVQMCLQHLLGQDLLHRRVKRYTWVEFIKTLSMKTCISLFILTVSCT